MVNPLIVFIFINIRKTMLNGEIMILNEILKPFLSEPERYEYSSEPQTDKNLQIIDDEPVYGNSFFDNDIFGMGQSSNSSLQTVKIDQYRKIA